ncbi:MAG: hypothetical protein K2I36_00790 [Ureaplasma sp.]|nr:hypothetical protein [Ureaplasma sp.]
MNSKIRSFNINLIFNVINIFIGSLIMLIPMIIFAINYQEEPNSYQLFQPGFDRVNNLVISIVITIVTISLICANGYRMWNHFKNLTNKKWFNKDYKWITTLMIISVVSVIIYLVAFFTIWLYPMPNINNSEISNYNWLRLQAYIITYCVLTILFLSLATTISLLTSKRILSHCKSINSEIVENE